MQENFDAAPPSASKATPSVALGFAGIGLPRRRCLTRRTPIPFGTIPPHSRSYIQS
jgi:hypothetical protein